jgi:hypothetical protein
LSEGPYRDLGGGFARLTGIEGVRRAPSRIETVEDALFELVRNATDAGASNIYIATALHARRYRELVVLDDGDGVTERYREMIFEPGVTTRHLSPSRAGDLTHGAGLSLHHIKEAALSAELRSGGSPTAIRIVFDTQTLPERALQSGPGSRRDSRTNLHATLQSLARAPGAPELFYGSPASILATLLNNRIIQKEDATFNQLESWCEEKMGVRLSGRTLQRVTKGLVKPAEKVVGEDFAKEARGGEDLQREGKLSSGSGRLDLDARDLAEIKGIMERAARESYLEVSDLGVESDDGAITIWARVYESEGEYDE